MSNNGRFEIICKTNIKIRSRLVLHLEQTLRSILTSLPSFKGMCIDKYYIELKTLWTTIKYFHSTRNIQQYFATALM